MEFKRNTAPECYLELVIAWGCGWHGESDRPAQPGEWQVWASGAIFALSDMVEESINKTIDLLGQILDLTHERVGTGALTRGEMHALANLISIELVRDRCSCGHHQRGCKVSSGEQRTCRRLCCRDEHRLSLWSPGVCSLQAFVAQAVRGSATDKLLPGAFDTSALYPRLTEDTGLSIGPVEFKICHKCHKGLIDGIIKAVEASQKTGGIKIADLEINEETGQPKGLYERPVCPDCGELANPAKTYYLQRKNRVLIPIPYNKSGGGYQQWERWRCPYCKNLYALQLDRCPLCLQGRSKGARPARVWRRL
jgi:hypothetical protein